jgi:anthranilate phosphoribosyltransferase
MSTALATTIYAENSEREMSSREFGAVISALIAGCDLSRDEAYFCFRQILLDQQSEMQQGAFLAALAAKGETAAEIAGVWQAIYELDTVPVTIRTRQPLVENCGTGMDAVKTFNISTAAALIAAADGVPIARHGSRSITSACGTVDVLEALGINVECSVQTVQRSIEIAGIGIFNGTSAQVHPEALGRILSQMAFGSVLNISASLANPALPRIAVRGVSRRELLVPTARAMREIGYRRALVVYGEAEAGRSGGIDEASTMGRSYVCALSSDGRLNEYSFIPSDMGIRPVQAVELAGSANKLVEASRLKSLLMGKESEARTDIACLNAGLILYVSGQQPSIKAGYRRALDLVSTRRPINKLIDWINIQK